MNDEQKAAYIFAMSVCALAEIEGMKAQNQVALLRDNIVLYGKTDFDAVPDKYGIHHNSVLECFRSGA